MEIHTINLFKEAKSRIYFVYLGSRLPNAALSREFLVKLPEKLSHFSER
jgi:hypothetical protein